MEVKGYKQMPASYKKWIREHMNDRARELVEFNDSEGIEMHKSFKLKSSTTDCEGAWCVDIYRFDTHRVRQSMGRLSMGTGFRFVKTERHAQ